MKNTNRHNERSGTTEYLEDGLGLERRINVSSQSQRHASRISFRSRLKVLVNISETYQIKSRTITNHQIHDPQQANRYSIYLPHGD